MRFMMVARPRRNVDLFYTDVDCSDILLRESVNEQPHVRWALSFHH